MAETKKRQIRASLKIFGKTYKSKGTSVEEVLTKLNPPIAKGIGVLRLERGDKKKDDYLWKERILNTRALGGLFGQMSPIMKTIHLKNMVTLFDNFDK